jgi:plastocyanin
MPLIDAEAPCGDVLHFLPTGCTARRRLRPGLLFAACLLTAFHPLRAEDDSTTDLTTGTIRGTVVYLADPERPWRLGRYYIRDARTGELSEAVVALSGRRLKSPDGGGKPATVTVDQKNFQFTPETVAIRAGDRVRFLNSDDQIHNVKTNHPRHSFNITMPVDGEHVETFRSAGGIRRPYVLGCAFHSAMRAWVFVFDHPWFAVTAERGTFQLQHVPPGEYQLDVVHPAGDLRTRETVTVVAGETTQVQVRLHPSAQQK